MGIKSKAAHFVADLTTVFLNPISDKPSHHPTSHHHHHHLEEEAKFESNGVESTSDKDSEDSRDGPDTSSFTAFLVSLLSSSESKQNSNPDENNVYQEDVAEPSDVPVLRDSGRKRNLFSRSKQTLGRAIHHAARLGGFRNQAPPKGSSDMVVENGSNSKDSTEEVITVQHLDESMPLDKLPETSEPSLLLSEKTSECSLCCIASSCSGEEMVIVVQYLETRYITFDFVQEKLSFGFSLLVVGDRKGAVFGGLVDAPLRPTNKRRYQGSNNSFVFTTISGDPAIFQPTGVNRYYTLCSKEYIALGGGGHFALYLDENLLMGSSSASETYGNSCLAHSEDFDVNEVELWGFVYASKYEEMVDALRTEAPGICRW